MRDTWGSNALAGSPSSSAPADPESESKIRNGIGMSEQELGALHHAIESLERRLETALTPQPPSVVSADKIGNAPTPVNGHIVNRLQDLNRGIASAAERVRELLRRVEV